ncbi:MAG: thioredoxin fold domain-containing protein [Burkholderiaceae bacterium]|nr:thioredoxin fold domain-containing protein [Burkholderiaceae bacterium]
MRSATAIGASGLRRLVIRSPLAWAAATLSGLGPAAAARAAGAQAGARHLPRPESLAALLVRAERERRPIVALFSQAGCPFCEAIRREQLLHLASEHDSRGVIVVEFDIADARAFAASARGNDPRAGAPAAGASSAAIASRSPQPPNWREADSPEGLARALQIRVTPTVAFLGPRGELAQRLVGYASRDFYGAYLDERIESSRTAIVPR